MVAETVICSSMTYMRIKSSPNLQRGQGGCQPRLIACHTEIDRYSLQLEAGGRRRRRLLGSSALQLPIHVVHVLISPAAKGKAEELGRRAGKQIRAVPRKRRV